MAMRQRRRRRPLSSLLAGAAAALVPPSLSLDIGNRGPQRQQGQGGGGGGGIDLLARVESHLVPLEREVDRELFVTQLGVPSSVYRFRDLLRALALAGGDGGIAGSSFYLGDGALPRGWEYGLANLAAFLAQCMKETIAYDACDENNWDLYGGAYPAANACGQLGQSYQDYACPPGEEHVQCPIDPDMRMRATTHAGWYGAPPGLFCAPKSEYPWVGVWDYNYWCKNPWADPPESCDVYEGQKAGRFDHERPVASRGGRTDVEGCCWWGRGVIQTTGPCNFGKLNYYLGARAAAEGRDAKYPDIDFCKNPDKICSSEEHSELKWIAGFFYWMKDVQGYNSEGWYYIAELHKFVNSGMKGNGFIDAISGIVNRGCHNPPCATGHVDGLDDRRDNFLKVLKVFGLPSGVSRPPSAVPPLPSAEAAAPAAPVKTGDPKLLNAFLERLNSHRPVLERRVLSYQAVDGALAPSDLYTFDTLMESLAHFYDVGYGRKRFYLGPTEQSEPPDLRYGLVNIAAFLSQAQSEGIQGNTCDEYHVDAVGGKYPISNACGQFGNSYQDYECSGAGEKAVQCPVVEDARAAAASSGKYTNSLYDFRPPLYCGPDERRTGAYDPVTMLVTVDPVPNRAGRTDVRGCCFWGRGALLTRGVCMLGKLNYWLGRRASEDGRHALHPEMDFCADPGDICRDLKRRPSIVWDIAFFEWVERIQSYDDGQFNYMEKLHEFVNQGMHSMAFISTVSKIVAGGSASASGAIPFSGQRWSHFNLLMQHLQLKDPPPELFTLNSSPRRPISGFPMQCILFIMMIIHSI